MANKTFFFRLDDRREVKAKRKCFLASVTRRTELRTFRRALGRWSQSRQNKSNSYKNRLRSKLIKNKIPCEVKRSPALIGQNKETMQNPNTVQVACVLLLLLFITACVHICNCRTYNNSQKLIKLSVSGNVKVTAVEQYKYIPRFKTPIYSKKSYLMN